MSNAWIKSEDSFLQFFCEKSSYEWGHRYYWKEGESWGKFNFIRIFDDRLIQFVNSDELVKNINWFKEKNKFLNLKFNYLNLHKDTLLNKGFEKDGTPIVYLKTSSHDFSKKLQNDVELIECLNEKDLEQWWLINSDGRSRSNPLESPLWPNLLKGLNGGTHYYILKFNNENAVCGAINDFSEGVNLWGIATKEKFQRKNLMKDFYSLIATKTGKNIYGQVNLNSITHKWRLKQPSTEILYIEEKMVLKS